LRSFLTNPNLFEFPLEFSYGFEVGLQGIVVVSPTANSFLFIFQIMKERYYLVPLDPFDTLHGDLLSLISHCLLEELQYMKTVFILGTRLQIQPPVPESH